MFKCVAILCLVWFNRIEIEVMVHLYVCLHGLIVTKFLALLCNIWLAMEGSTV